MSFDEKMMRRALQLAVCGRGEVSPNPMVGAVIVCGGVIIGEGYHRRYGGPHAEVNAVDSVTHKSLLRESTMYVTLEPCAHYGKTPPCADLIVKCGIPRVVIGCRDPFAKVDGRGIDRLLAAGVEVKVGVLEEECRMLNRRFITAHTLHRPFVTLKWACSADGFLGEIGSSGPVPVAFSNPEGSVLVHKLRTEYDAILVGSGTVLADNPRLNVRRVDGRSPLKVVIDRRHRIAGNENIFSSGDTIVMDEPDVKTLLSALYDKGVTSLLVEGGAMVIHSFLESGEWDNARIEISPLKLGDKGYGHLLLPGFMPQRTFQCGSNRIVEIDNPLDVFGL